MYYFILRSLPWALMVIGFLCGKVDASGISDLKAAVTYYQGCESLKPSYPGESVHPDPLVQPGKIGKAFLIERRTVNLIADPDFNSIPTDAWLRIGNPQLATTGGFASPGCAIVNNSDYIRQVILNLQEDTLYCLSIYARSEDGGILELSMDCGSHERVESQTLTGEYTRVTLAFTAHAEVGTVTIKSTSNKSVTLDAVQLEGGKSWPASFFASTGVPRSGEWVDIPTGPESYDPMKGAVAFWFKPQWIGEIDGGVAFFSAFKDPDRAWQIQQSLFTIGAYMNPQEKEWRNSINIVMRSKSGQDMGYGIPIDDRFTPNEWFHLVVNWEITPGEESLSSCYINGNKVAEKRFFSDGMEQPANIYMGYAAGAYADALMDEFYLFNRPLTKEEVSELYATTEALK